MGTRCCREFVRSHDYVGPQVLCQQETIELEIYNGIVESISVDVLHDWLFSRLADAPSYMESLLVRRKLLYQSGPNVRIRSFHLVDSIVRHEQNPGTH